MAKEDFCFTFYDGDATRDMQHMDRLCRGAYMDILIMLRKVPKNRLTMDHIRAVLGKDFEACWYSLQIVLKQDGSFYYLEWLENSLAAMRVSAAKNKQKADKRWNKKNDDGIPPALKFNAAALKNNATAVPFLEDGNENENGNEEEIKKKGVQGETTDEPLPMGYLMQVKFMKINPAYPPRPANDMPAITEFANFFNTQLGGKNEIAFFNTEERESVMQAWELACHWYTRFGNGYDLAFLAKYKMQKIYSDIKTPNKNGNQGTQNNFGSFKGSRHESSGQGGY